MTAYTHASQDFCCCKTETNTSCSGMVCEFLTNNLLTANTKTKTYLI